MVISMFFHTQIFGIFCMSLVIDFQCNSIMVHEHALYSFYSFKFLNFCCTNGIMLYLHVKFKGMFHFTVFQGEFCKYQLGAYSLIPLTCILVEIYQICYKRYQYRSYLWYMGIYQKAP